MAIGEVAVGEHREPVRERIVNDMSLQVATVNGSGSQSANTVLLRTIFNMGVPVSGKNLFPSNIAGLPTWYTIRANRRGYIARKKEIDFLIAMNAETAQGDVESLSPGAAVLFDEPLNLAALRPDLHYYAVPFDKLVATVTTDAKLRKLLKNMTYVGVAAHLLGLDMAAVETAINKQFAAKAKAAALNVAAARAGYDFAIANLEKHDPYWIGPMNENVGKIIIDGNAAAALGAVFGGVTVVTWYPITPSSSLCETMIDYLGEYRVTPEGKATFAVVQAEDELAAVGMVLGAGWCGARAMTATSGPGISLMAEFAGLGYFVEVPAVIWDIQRVGPSTGLPTRTSQGDISFAAYLSHGDTRQLCLYPATVSECFDFAIEAFDLAERLQTPVFVLSDLDLGMNNWVSEPFRYPEKPIERGKVLSREDLQRMGSFARYQDVDGDGICYRTLPGTMHPEAAYFARGTGHNEKAQYSERPDDFENNMARLLRKLDTARRFVPKPEIDSHGHKVGIIGFGTSHWALLEARDQLREEHRLDTDYLRIRAYPFTEEVEAFVRAHERVYVIEQNRDAQMMNMLKAELPAELATRFRSIAHLHGLPLDARSVTNELIQKERA